MGGDTPVGLEAEGWGSVPLTIAGNLVASQASWSSVGPPLLSLLVPSLQLR